MSPQERLFLRLNLIFCAICTIEIAYAGYCLFRKTIKVCLGYHLIGLMMIASFTVFISGCQASFVRQSSGLPALYSASNRTMEPLNTVAEEDVGTAHTATVQEPVTSLSKEALGPDDARILMRSTGMPMNVDYSISESEVSCKDFNKVGTVRDKGEKVLSSWIVKLGEKLNGVPDQIETVARGGKPLQVAAWGNWYDSKSKGNCGPVILSFQPEAGRTYLVEFVWQGAARCMSRVQDVTAHVSRMPVASVSKVCSRSFMDVWLGRSGL